MRWLLLLSGLLLAMVGIVWMLQGTGQLGGSPMTGHAFWAWAGLVAAIAGLGLLFAGILRGTRPPPCTS